MYVSFIYNLMKNVMLFYFYNLRIKCPISHHSESIPKRPNPSYHADSEMRCYHLNLVVPFGIRYQTVRSERLKLKDLRYLKLQLPDYRLLNGNYLPGNQQLFSQCLGNIILPSYRSFTL